MPIRTILRSLKGWRVARRAGIGTLAGTNFLGTTERIIGYPGILDDLSKWPAIGSWVFTMLGDLPDAVFIVLFIFTIVLVLVEWFPPVRRAFVRIFTRRRVFTPRTVGEILSAFDGRTDREARLMSGALFGKWIKVSGVVREIVETPKQFHILVLTSEDHHVELLLSLKWRNDVNTLTIGDTVEAKGKIEGIDRYSVCLANSELAPVPTQTVARITAVS